MKASNCLPAEIIKNICSSNRESKFEGTDVVFLCSFKGHFNHFSGQFTPFFCFAFEFRSYRRKTSWHLKVAKNLKHTRHPFRDVFEPWYGIHKKATWTGRYAESIQSGIGCCNIGIVFGKDFNTIGDR